ncbi:MAG: hypothetical protein R3F19_10840 [Verrucomicrobiales bacterium]
MKGNRMMMEKIFNRIPLWIAAVAIGGSILPLSHTAAQDSEDTNGAAAELPDLTPKRYKMNRYESIWAERSPFEIIVEDEGPVVDEPPPFEDYTLAGYSKRGNVWRVTVVNLKDPKEKHYLETGKVTEDGFELLNVKQERNYRKTEIVVRRAGKSGNIGFSDKYLKPATFAGGKSVGGAVGGAKQAPRGKPGRAAQGVPGLGNQPQAPATAAAAAGNNNKTDAAAQIRQMLQNRANGSNNGRASTTQQGSKREPRRRVILPPKR